MANKVGKTLFNARVSRVDFHIQVRVATNQRRSTGGTRKGAIVATSSACQQNVDRRQDSFDTTSTVCIA